ncbi:LOW QUALITY PROTEIN: leucyl-cystinyl aminopeptidase [Bufo gargarizans]|uniref:LOW QUALITY PROTEIN: leucyl-cystinyl aminopeptidase n=1 Tax=Bufo gargarizans TaxID=30331 RepID=UPI001CF43072|nr:LOW QUALITY PROTEIN: leucyl-cystinyl aminopeptidase [Bufo gargarizans]
MDAASTDRTQLPRNMIENSMFEEEPDVVDLAKEPNLNPLESEEVEYEPRSSRLLVRGLGEHELDDDEENYESSAKLLGMSFMNRSSGLRSNSENYRQIQEGLCPVPSVRTVIVGIVLVVILVSVITVIYLLPKCTFTKEGCHKKTHPMEQIYPIATNGELFPWTKSRLPNYIKPLEYDITLYPNLTTMTFSGKVNIKLNIVENTKAIVLHSSGLQDIQANVNLPDGAIHSLSVLEYPTFEMIAMVLSEPLLKGTECLLTIEYHSNLSSSYYGFYKISYMNENKSSRWLAATQFEPLAARKAFPCFDEPAFKSTFRLKMKRSKEYISLSNMPKTNTSVLPDGLLLDEFATSVKMSTYLVAFIVSEMKNVTANVNGTLVSVYAVQQKMDQAQYALNASIVLLEFFSEYFQIEYPLKKLDLVAIPDIQAGAMENWGLLTFRETTLLYKENSSSLMDKQLITEVIAHELAHQWFGNLVTMEWWNDLWLNEGFATYMEYFALQSKFQDLNADDNFLMARCRALEKDSLQTTHAISTDVQSPEQIEEIFDDLSYIKGASILQMLNAYLSEKVFHECIVKYLQDHQYGTTKSDGLWDSMNLVTKSNPDVKNIMKTWTRQAGYPLVTVERKGKEVFVSQERFLRTVNSSNATGNSSTLWNVPLSYTFGPCEGAACFSAFLLSQKQGKFVLPSEPSWLKFNVKMAGYYIVDYGQDGWDALINQLRKNHTVFAASDRANLIHDMFALSSVGKIPLSKVFDFLSYLVNETDIVPIRQALQQLRIIQSLLAKQGFLDVASNLETRAFDLLSHQINKQEWTDDGSLSEQELRSLLLDLACMRDDIYCVHNATELFNAWRSNGTHLPTAVRKVVFKVGARTDDGWEHLYNMYCTSLSEAEKMKMLGGLASTYNGKKLQWLMSASLHGEGIRSQDFPTVIRLISENIPGHVLAWNFVKQNWDEITQKFLPGSFPIQSIVTKTTAHFGTEVYLNEVINFFNSTKGKSREMWCVKEAIETIKLNIDWIDKNHDDLFWL